MNLTKKLGVILLSVWLIVYGLAALIGLAFQGFPQVMGALAIGAGVLLLLDR
jgi:hypothetical protein